MIKKKKTYQKDNYGRYVKSHEFDRYWDEYHNLEDISMKESIRQRKEREKNIKNSNETANNGYVDRDFTYQAVGYGKGV